MVRDIDHIEGTNNMENDLISRQWLMECVNEGWIEFDTEKDENRFIHLVRDIAPTAQPDLSSYSDKLWRAAYERGKAEAQTQRMRGRWFHVAYAQEYKYQCDQCGCFHRAMYDFCPSCGADMRGEQDEH